MNEVENNLDRQTGRNYGIDALRIISMLMIVTLHVLGHGADIWSLESDSLRNSILWFFETIALCSVNCYALVSGYVGIHSKYKISNLITLWIQVAFYSITFVVISKIVYPDVITKIDIIKAFFPVLSGQYWYFTGYFILFLFIPILNYAVEHIAKIKMGLTLLLMICSVSVFGLMFNTVFGGDIFTLNGGYSPWWLIILYLIGAYISKYRVFAGTKNRWLILLFVCSTALTYLTKALLPVIENQLFGEVKYSGSLFNYTSITVLISAISLLLLFAKLKTNKLFCNMIAFLVPMSFGVYLIHENPFIRRCFISGRFVFLLDLDIPVMILVLIGCVIGVYILCSAIDLIRYWIFKSLRIKPCLATIEIKARERIRTRVETK